MDTLRRMCFDIGMNTDHTLEEVGQQFSVKQLELLGTEPPATFCL